MAGLPFMQNDLKGVTQDEISKLTKAMKDEKFREHMDEYVKEISDPAHRKEYLQYLAQLESKGEMPEGQCLLRAQPGCCAKTTIRFKNGQSQKCFINIVHSNQLDDLSFRPAEKGKGQNVNLPYSLSPPRPDRDSKDEYCMTCDFAVSSHTFGQAMQNPQILKMLVDTACEGLSTRFLQGHEEVKKDFKLMQRMACKGGHPMPMSVQAQLMKDKGSIKAKVPKGGMKDAVTPSELKEMRDQAKKKKAEKEKAEEQVEEEVEVPKKPPPIREEDFCGRIRVPKHKLVHVGQVDLSDYMENKNQATFDVSTVPRSLRLVVELPTVKSASAVTLEVTSNNVVVEVDGKYYLDLPLSYEIRDQEGSAKFDKVKQELTLELPVVPKAPILNMAAARLAQGATQADDDGGISEGHGSEDELEELTEPKEAKEAEAPAAEAPAAQEEEKEEEEEEEAAAPPKEEANDAPKRQVLEFESKATLQIARPSEEDEEQGEVEAAVQEADEASDDESGAADRPAFIECDFFEGAKPGYYFSKGKEGLGYYLDSRQPLRKPGRAAREVQLTRTAARSEAPGRPGGPLVTEVARRAPEPEVQRPPLPASLRSYVDSTAALSRHVEAKEAQGSLPMEWHQTRQNVMLNVDLPRGHQVADVTLALKAYRLTITFCVRASADAPWRRHRLCRMLGGAADPRQWHAELVPAAGPEAGPRLAILLRKADRAVGTPPWPEVVGAEELQPLIQDAVPAAPAAPSAEAEVVPKPDAAEPPASEASAPPAAAGVPCALGPLGGSKPVEAPLEDLDSAELDAVAPEVTAEGAAVAATAAPLAVATAAIMAQSAAVMGQSVLLQNRLMYQLM